MDHSDHGTTYMRVGGEDGELRPWRYMYVYGIERKLKPPQFGTHFSGAAPCPETDL
jgi:hypothetical protein